MLLRCSVLFVVFISNVLHTQGANIPVAVVYNQRSQSLDSQKNLDAKVQLPADELLKSEQVISKNAENSVSKTEAQQVGNLKRTLLPEETQSRIDAENNIEQQSSHDNYIAYFLKKAEEITFSGIQSIKENIDKASETLNDAKPNAETWQKLNQTLEQFFSDQHKGLKQDKPPENNNNNQGNQIQNFINSLQTTWNNFVNNNLQQNQTQGGSEDEQTGQQNQNPWQGISNMFQNGFTQVLNNINNVNRQNSTSGEEDTGSGGSGGGFFGNFVSQVPNFFQQQNQGTQISNNQSDTGVQPQNPGGFFQQVINNFRPPTTTKAPSQGDEGVSSTTQSNNIFGNFGQAFQNVNFFGQQTTKAPQASGSSPSNPIQTIGSQFGQVIGGQEGGSGGSNPIISGIQSFGNQTGGGSFGGGPGGSNPIISGIQSFGNQTGGGPFGAGSGGSNPIISGIQSFGNQTGGGPFGTGGNNPLQNVQNAISKPSSSGDSSDQKNDEVEKSN